MFVGDIALIAFLSLHAYRDGEAPPLVTLVTLFPVDCKQRD
jgi:hypothetical protein